MEANKSWHVTAAASCLLHLLAVAGCVPILQQGYAAAASSVNQISQRGSCICGCIQMPHVQQQVPQFWGFWHQVGACRAHANFRGSVQASHVQQQEAVWLSTVG